MNTCQKCGKPSPAESDFCTFCGTRFCADLHDLLKGNDLDAYFGMFRRNHILSPNDLSLLEESNFDELGIAAIGDRTRLRNVIRSLRGQHPISGHPAQAAADVASAEVSNSALPASSQPIPGVEPVRKSRVAYILFALFLGSFGVHNFYAGRNTPGTIQLLLTLGSCFYLAIVSAVWAWIEAFTVKLDGRGVPFK